MAFSLPLPVAVGERVLQRTQPVWKPRAGGGSSLTGALLCTTFRVAFVPEEGVSRTEVEMKQYLSNRGTDPQMNWFEGLQDWERELARTGAAAWRVSSVNDRFEMATSLPRFNVVPQRILDTELKRTFAHFTEGRIPEPGGSAVRVSPPVCDCGGGGGHAPPLRDPGCPLPSPSPLPGSNCEVLTTLTPDTGRILSKLHAVTPKGKITFCTGIRVAHLALKHRQGKNHKLRIIAFVGSPVEDSEKDALRVSMEEQRQRQEDEARRAAVTSAAEAGIPTPIGDESDEALLQMAVRQPESSGPGLPDFSSMSEEEQIAYAMQMSLQGAGRESCTMLTAASLYQLYRAQRLTAASLYQLYQAQRLTAASLSRAQRLTAASLHSGSQRHRCPGHSGSQRFPVPILFRFHCCALLA
ncbi:UNVERIFIED_CONTAM: hypothetical protein FKN15_011730 [Acipenser sinensis]